MSSKTDATTKKELDLHPSLASLGDGLQAVSAPSEMKLRGKLQACSELEPRTLLGKIEDQVLSRPELRCNYRSSQYV